MFDVIVILVILVVVFGSSFIEEQAKKQMNRVKKQYDYDAKVVKVGTKISSGGSVAPIVIGDWAWPTISKYYISSYYGWRWGTLHDGLDISGTGYGSPIYAAQGGVVYQSQYGGIVGNSAGYNVVIEHPNGYFTVYAHCSKLYVKKGQVVQRKQKIAAMGASGTVTGTHLHFGVFTGKPYNGGRSIDPRKLWS